MQLADILEWLRLIINNNKNNNYFFYVNYLRIVKLVHVYHINILPNVDKYVVRRYHTSDVDIRNENIT